MASLPGVRLLGPMTDPLGRSGYGITAGPQDPNTVNGALKAVVIDPASGSLLATEEIGPIPRSVQCLTQQGPWGGGNSVGEAYVGRSYPGQVDEFVALVSAGWTDASPSLPPATHEDPLGFPGLPPAVP